MMTLVRWHRAPDARTLQHEMSRLMQAFSQGGMQDRRTWQQRTWAPAIDLSEDADAFTLTAELTGFSKDDVQVEVKDNQLTLKGERKRDRC
jgi:HSP20 family protein